MDFNLHKTIRKLSKISRVNSAFSTFIVVFIYAAMSPLKAAIPEQYNISGFQVKTISVVTLTASTISAPNARLLNARFLNVRAAKGVQKHVKVADAGFGISNPYMTSTKTKKYKTKYIKKVKAHNKYEVHNKYQVKAPKYSLGYKNPKGYIKTYNYNSELNDPYSNNTAHYFTRYQSLSPKSGGAYRTMCVRLKDGFYWPISFARSKSDFRKDRIKCHKSCSDKVRLFYYRNTSDDMASMRDLKGKQYTSLKTAFLYREKYVKDAICKPKPWSEAAKAIHDKYAVLDAEKKRRMHIAQSKRAEKLRVAALTSSKKYRRLKSRYVRTLNTAVKKARRVKKTRYRKKVARIYKRKKISRYQSTKYRKYRF